MANEERPAFWDWIYGDIHPEWWQRKMTVDELLAQCNEYPDRFRLEMNEFIQKLQPGDELWSFITPPETWNSFPHCGLEGFGIVRDGSMVELLITALS